CRQLLQHLVQRRFRRLFLRLVSSRRGASRQTHRDQCDLGDLHCTLTLPLPVTRARKSFPLLGFFTRMVAPVVPFDWALPSKAKCAPPAVTSTSTRSPLLISGARLTCLRIPV